MNINIFAFTLSCLNGLRAYVQSSEYPLLQTAIDDKVPKTTRVRHQIQFFPVFDLSPLTKSST